MLDLGFVALLTAWSAGIGLWALRRLDSPPGHPVDDLAQAVPLGLGLLGLATLGLAESGVLNRTGLATVLALGAALVVRDAWRPSFLGGGLPSRLTDQGSRLGQPGSPLPPGEGARRAGEGLRPRERNSPARLGPRPPPPARDECKRHQAGEAGGSSFSLRSPDPIMGLVLLAAVVGTLLTALAPVTDGDALCYHLQVPKLFLSRGATVFDPDLHETVYPLLTESLYAVALAFRGPVACRVVHWVLGLAFAANVTALARPSLGVRSWWAGVVALLVPAVSNSMGAPLNDAALAAFGTAAMVAWTRFHDHPSDRRAALVGILAGLALGVKYPALVWTGLLGLAMVASSLVRGRLQGSWGPAADLGLGAIAPGAEAGPQPPEVPSARLDSVRGGALDPRDSDRVGTAHHLRPMQVGGGYPKGTCLKHLAIFGMTAILVGGGWYLRAWVHTGNPVYPFFRHVFGGAGLDEVLDPIKRPMPVSAWNLLTALGSMTLEPDRFDSFSHQFGPVFLLFLPALALERAPRRVLAIAGLGYAMMMLCWTQRQSMRFVLIGVGPLAVAVAWLASTWWERRSTPGRILVATLMLALGFEASLALARSRHGLGVVLGRETEASFLARREPTFRVARWVDRHLPADARLVGQDHRGFYFPRDYTMELAHRRRTGLGTRGESALEVVAGLSEAGFTHVLLAPPIPETAVEFDPTLGKLLAPWLAGRSPLYRAEIEDPDGVVRRYEIHELSPRVATRTTGGGRR